MGQAVTSAATSLRHPRCPIPNRLSSTGATRLISVGGAAPSWSTTKYSLTRKNAGQRKPHAPLVSNNHESREILDQTGSGRTARVSERTLASLTPRLQEGDRQPSINNSLPGQRSHANRTPARQS
jgi:hypothetical protein